MLISTMLRGGGDDGALAGAQADAENHRQTPRQANPLARDDRKIRGRLMARCADLIAPRWATLASPAPGAIMERFIVGTGRCGSTLLSRMLAQHDAALSVFELFNGIDAARRFSSDPMTGEAFAALISAEQPFVTAVLRRGYDVAEVAYPFDAGGRYRRDDPLPWILVATLPRLTDEPDRLFDELMNVAKGFPRQPAVAQYRALFAWLVERMGRGFWIERSGSSIDYLGALVETFPDARFLHIHRDGPEVALSMLEHHAYRLPVSLMYDAPLDGGVRLAELGAVDLGAEPTGDDPISRVLASRPPAEVFGRYWSDQVERGARARSAISSDRYAEVRFEDLVTEPAAELARIAAFFELPAAPGWIERAADLVRGTPRLRLNALSPEPRGALLAACAPGQQRLGR